jgi:hypothetical protein
MTKTYMVQTYGQATFKCWVKANSKKQALEKVHNCDESVIEERDPTELMDIGIDFVKEIKDGEFVE